MTPLPKKKLTRARQGKRRASIKLETIKTSKCANCGAAKIPHQACSNCGMYRGRMITVPKTEVKVRRITKE